jgi:hypothetical protein
MKTFKKLHVDTIVNTAHFIKKSIMVPLKIDDDGNQLEPNNTSHAFMRGIMNFDDYNYRLYNRYVLVEDPSIPVKIKTEKVVPLPSTNRKLTIDGNEIMALSEKNLDLKQERDNDGPYYHDAITIEPSEYQQE